jgi:hypothetical protein
MLTRLNKGARIALCGKFILCCKARHTELKQAAYLSTVCQCYTICYETASETVLMQRSRYQEGPWLEDVHEPHLSAREDRRLHRVCAFRLALRALLMQLPSRFDYAPKYREALAEIAGWLQQGLVQRKFHVVEGLDNAPSALPMLFKGSNTGKLCVIPSPMRRAYQNLIR